MVPAPLRKQIILEGPELGGKSSVARIIKERLGIKSFHAGGPPNNRDEVFKRFEALPRDQVWDRCTLISELVYGPIFRNISYIGFSESFLALQALDPIIIYCRPSDKHLRHALQFLKRQNKPHKDEQYNAQVRENHSATIEKYDDLMEVYEVLGLDVIRYNLTIHTPENILEKINEYIRHQ